MAGEVCGLVKLMPYYFNTSGYSIPVQEPALLFGIFFITVLFGIVFHATAVVILLFPICVNSGLELFGKDFEIHKVLVCLMVGAGCQMLSPISYQTNLMAYIESQIYPRNS